MLILVIAPAITPAIASAIVISVPWKPWYFRGICALKTIVLVPWKSSNTKIGPYSYFGPTSEVSDLHAIRNQIWIHARFGHVVEHSKGGSPLFFWTPCDLGAGGLLSTVPSMRAVGLAVDLKRMSSAESPSRDKEASDCLVSESDISDDATRALFLFVNVWRSYFK